MDSLHQPTEIPNYQRFDFIVVRIDRVPAAPTRTDPFEIPDIRVGDKIKRK